LVLCLGNEKFMFIVCEELALFRVKVDIVTVDPGGVGGNVPIATLDTDLDVVVLKRHEREHLGPVFTEEERNHVMITCVVFLPSVGRESHRRLRGGVTHEWVVYTLNKKRIQLGNLLTTNP